MKSFLIPFLLATAQCYELIKTFHFNFTDINLEFCDGSTEQFKESVHNVTDYLDTFNYLPKFNNKTEAKIVPICEIDMPSSQYGYTRFTSNDQYRDIKISTRLESYPITQYNVILHELVHLFGLNHVSNYTEIMGYKVTLDRQMNVKEDTEKHVLGIDDITGLKYLYKREMTCKRKIIKLLNECLE